MAITFGDLITSSKNKADMLHSDFISDTEWKENVNNSAGELYDILINEYEDYNRTSFDFTLTGGASGNKLTVPDDFMKMRGLRRWRTSEDDAFKVPLFQFDDYDRLARRNLNNLYGDGRVAYELAKNIILIRPSAAAGANYTLYYIPKLPIFTDLADEVDSYYLTISGWHEYIVVDVAIKALAKEESDVQTLQVQKEQLKQRIITSAANRNAGDVARIQSTYGGDDDDFGFGYGGW